MGFILPQFGIFAQGTHAHHFLEFDLRPDVTPTAAVASFRRLRTSEVSAGGVNLVVAFGADAWREVAPAEAPASLDRFHAITAPDGRGAPATQHDAWIWISSSSADVAFDHARAAASAVADAALLVAEQQGFTYHEGRDETGFIDGTANPPVRRAAEVALVPPGEPGQGGSHVLAMRWVHDLDAFHSLPVERAGSRDRANQGRRASSCPTPTSHPPHTSRASRSRPTAASSRSSVGASRTGTSASTACTSWPSARTRHGTTACSRGCSGPPATAFTTA